MIISKLTLQNFRSFPEKEITFSPLVTILLGPNACGKTTILEAIFLLATGKSFRVEKDLEMISFKEEIGRVKGSIEITQLDAEQIDLEIVLSKGEVMGIKTPMKKYSVNEVGKRMIDIVGRLKVVLFWPEDLELVTDSPSLRRRYLDFVLIQVDREYRRTLLSYEKGLRQRNRLLEAIREKEAHRHQLIFWDQLLIKNGEYITRRREEYIDFVNKLQISNDKLQIKSKIQNPNYQLEYDRSIISRQRLDQYSQEEVAAGVTLVGPHRDDVKFKIQNSKFKIKNEEYRDLSHYGSRGEQRLAVLWLKLGELAYIEAQTGGKPVLLLDDILSELDHEHRKIIFEVIGNQQTLMTMTDKHFIEKNKLKNAEIIEL
ncbi:hypothetical protein A2960_05485 [Candidatus Gottesmanbacteria bacterium RIFCSPLOWO2_01_FULL_39_12b]|uniref:DNA replication and repair protein RecF n=1 Tax=Candidatus Gottesmanbacteria bacterium RIFCSPLOWO2_01_FULL_39_12b TaxID=1798388 RepID=A0A1F6AM50_9BACT|nr:MAG: hypothetical protein A2960_05485 [Candidatus Gottesmanbacteria bacterium RIFCSPLOWO2_01_FULL_39_12b]